jgi:uncharacterized protein (UPF0210 family)
MRLCETVAPGSRLVPPEPSINKLSTAKGPKLPQLPAVLKMKVRAVTIGVALKAADFGYLFPATEASTATAASTAGPTDGCSDVGRVIDIIRTALSHVNAAATRLREDQYEVQTVRIALNSFEEWNPTLSMAVFAELFRILDELDVKLCAIGNCSSLKSIALIPDLLARCDRISCSVQLQRQSEFDCAPEYSICLAAAETCLGVARSCGDLGNFRYCIGFNCPAGIPFFPTAFHDASQRNNSITIGLENADLLFLSFYGAKTLQQGSANLLQSLKQVLGPIQSIMEQYCSQDASLYFNGIDASINPGLTLPESVGQGMEHILNVIEPGKKFGTFGTLSAVAAVTSAFKLLKQENVIKLAGYSGLMLPVMEDLVLAERSLDPGTCYSLRDLLTFSSVCGVGLDTVPIAGDALASDLANVYMETGTMAFRLNKPLTARLLPIAGRTAGDASAVTHPSLVNSKIFALK